MSRRPARSRGEDRTNSEQRARPQAVRRPNFVSYHASRQQLDSTPAATRQPVVEGAKPLGRKGKRGGQILHWSAGVILLVCVVYSLTLGGSARFSMTNPQGVPMLRSTQIYQQKVSEILGSSIFNKNKLTIDTAKISSQIKAAFPELDTVEVVLPFMGRKPVVEVTTGRPALYFSGTGGTFVVNAKGRAVIDTAQLQGSARNLNIPTVKDQANIDLGPGKAVLTSQDVTFITTLAKQFAAQNISIASIELPPLASELHVRVNGQPYYIKFSLLTDPRIASGQYFALRQKLDADHVTPKEYIDSRVEEKIYYK